MTNEEQNPKVHHMTAKAARNALAGKRISQESYAAVLSDELSLEEAKGLGRSRGPSGAPQPVSTLSKDDRIPEPCMCGCNERLKRPGSRWIPGHDARAFGWANAVARGEDIELTDEQRRYIESSGKLQRAREKAERDEQRRQGKTAAKAERQRRKEGEAESKKQDGK